MKPIKKREYKSPKGWLTTAQVMETLGVSHSTLYRIYPDIFSESETILFHERRIFKAERVNAYLAEQIEACSSN